MYRKKMRGMYISKKALKNQFDPSKFPRETYLLCKLRWGESDRSWIHWVKNYRDDYYHAEVYFLEKIFRMKPYTNVKCSITWYLSWSPCVNCCYEILDFLERHKNVKIDIHVARLYFKDSEGTHRGLKKLARSTQVKINVMNMEDYKDCSKTFIQGGAADDFWTVNFESEIKNNCSKLCRILELRHFDENRLFPSLLKNDSLAREGQDAKRNISGDLLSSRLALSPTSWCKRNRTNLKPQKMPHRGRKRSPHTVSSSVRRRHFSERADNPGHYL